MRDAPRVEGFNPLLPEIQGERTSHVGASVTALDLRVLLKLLYFPNQIADVSNTQDRS